MNKPNFSKHFEEIFEILLQKRAELFHAETESERTLKLFEVNAIENALLELR